MNLLSRSTVDFCGPSWDHFYEVSKTFSLFNGVRVTSDELHSMFSLVDGLLGSLSTAPVPGSSRAHPAEHGSSREIPRSGDHPALIPRPGRSSRGSPLKLRPRW